MNIDIEQLSEITRNKVKEIISKDTKKIKIQKTPMNGVLILERKLNGEEKFYFIVDESMNIEILDLVLS